MALSRVLGRTDLARKISEVFESRQNIGYRMFLEHNQEEKENAQKIVDDKILPFIKEIDALIEKESN